MDSITISIDGKKFTTEPGKTILEVAKEQGIDIPTLCFHPDVETNQHCNMCMIEIKGENNFRRACSTVVKDGMEITTQSKELLAERKQNLDIILKNHLLECSDCVWFSHCKLLDLVQEFKAKPVMQKNEADKVLQVGGIVFDQTKCIGCEHCLEVCPVDFLSMNERSKVNPASSTQKDCINCGQCVLHCPVGAIEGVGEFEELEKIFEDKSKTVVVQFAPSIRSSIGEEFGMDTGKIATGQLVAGLKQVGFHFVFDTAAGADFTTMEESDELVERITQNKNLPAMTSCCPAWVKFMEFNYPEFLPHLCTSRSPQVMLGGVIKSYWAKENKIKPENIFVVSIMPCVAKKFEIKREELKIDDVYPVDMVLTTRELVRLFKKYKVDLKNIQEKKADNPLGTPSGAGVIYGSSGGVVESAMRTAYFKITGKELANEDIKEVRGPEGIKIKQLRINDRDIKICVISSIKNAKKVLEELKQKPDLYDAVEVMACPGGCVGGGGQSMPTTRSIVKKRAATLYTIDDEVEIKRAHENQDVKKVYDTYLTNPEIRHKILHTNFFARKRSQINELENSKKTVDLQL